MITVVNSVALSGIDGIIVSVEAGATSSPHPRLDIIGLPDAAVKEASGRVGAAARSCGIELKKGVLTVNLAPADFRKEGSVYDLPILLSLAEDSRLKLCDFSKRCFIGELSLRGELRPVSGCLPMAVTARDRGFREIYVPAANAEESSAAEGINVFGVTDLHQLLDHLSGVKPIIPTAFDRAPFESASLEYPLDFRDVKGQQTAKYAAEIAAAGSHNMLLIGPPGSGKSMIASRLPSILPPLTLREAIECSKIYSVAGLLTGGLITTRPFRSPHHSVSDSALVGGGSNPRPGEISLADNGVLFLDEFTEFGKSAREALRQPLETRSVTVSRVNRTVTYPASFMMVCAMNPCRCGYFGHPTRECTCSPSSRHEYISRISGPLLDRIDIQTEVPPVDYRDLHTDAGAESSAVIRGRVMAARGFAAKRFGPADEFVPNALLSPSQIKAHCVLTPAAEALLEKAYSIMSLSARGHDRLLKVARTIADLSGSEWIDKQHIAQAIQLRSLDRKYWSQR